MDGPARDHWYEVPGPGMLVRWLTVLAFHLMHKKRNLIWCFFLVEREQMD